MRSENYEPKERPVFSTTHKRLLETPLKKLFPVFGLQPFIHTIFPFLAPRHIGDVAEFVQTISAYISDNNEVKPSDTLRDLLRRVNKDKNTEMQHAITRYLDETLCEERPQLTAYFEKVEYSIKKKKPIPRYEQEISFLP